jgi:KaiC/GvpD/RAD55 family RecA-like ATPase
MRANVKSSDKQQTEKLVHLPYELMQFVQRNTYSLLIKGYAGTGKTTLSLSILGALRIKKNFFYISTRLSPKQLFLYYPWLGKFVGRSKEAESDEMSSQGYNLSSFEDARLDEPESLFERITNQLMDVKAPIIIIDSWDAIASFMDKEARLNNERVLQTWRERAGAKLIFISEDPKDTTLDFLVDGIIELGRRFYENIGIREMLLLKLRGIRINRPSYIYSLNNGIFRSFDPFKPGGYALGVNSELSHKRIQRSVLPSSEKPYITTGYKELDVVLGGGFPRKGIVFLETDPHINAKLILAFLAKIMSNIVASSNPVLFQPFAGISYKLVAEYLKPHLSAEPESGLIKVVNYSPKFKRVDHDTSLCYDQDNFEKQFKTFHDMLIKTRQQFPNRLLLNVMGIDMFQKQKNNRQFDRMESISLMKENIDLSLIVSMHSQNPIGLELVSGLIDIHLRFIIINGTIFLQSLVPWDHLCAILIDRMFGYPQIQLEPVI